MSAKPDVDAVASRLVSAYATRGPLSLAYGQGSVFTGFAADSDLDIVMVWEHHIPGSRPARAVSDTGTDPVVIDDAGYSLDKLRVSGWDVDVIHHTRSEFDRWFAEVGAGGGWRHPAWPLPLHSVAGFVYGTDLHDPTGEARTLRDAVRTPSDALVTSSMRTLRESLPGHAAELGHAVVRSDGWLFHLLAGELIKHAYVAWFASEGRYLPFPTHFARWTAHLGLDPHIVAKERSIWDAADLPLRRDAITAFVEAVLARG